MARDLDLDAILAGSDAGAELPAGHRSGFVCLVGRPNVGKSTLLNAMVGAKVAIVTDVPGTTRNAIRGVVTRDDAQIVFVDTPGLRKPRTVLAQRLNQVVYDTWAGVDAVCFLLDAAGGVGRGDRFLARRLAGIDTPVICVPNKEDLLTPKELLIPVLEEVAELGEWAEIVPTSATAGTNVQHLQDVLVSYLPRGPRLFPGGTLTDQPERQLVGEIVREKLMARLEEELPHSVAVVVDEFRAAEHRDDLLEIFVTVYVERDSQKPIVIGRGGSVIKAAGTAAREELETLLGSKVFLDARVAVASDWQRDPRRLEGFGY